MERVFGLDLLRSIAVLMVLLAHTRFFLRPLIPATQALSIFGFLGVELFFVLSGFLIGGILLRSFDDRPNAGTLTRFWVRRWFRTLPNYYLFLGVNLALRAWEGQGFGGLAGYGVFLQNLAWPCPYFFNESWSLAIEEWFYLIFPILIFLLSRLRAEKRFAVAVSLGLLFLFSTAARGAAVALGSPSWDDGIRKVVAYRLDALMIGVLGAFLKNYAAAAWQRVRGAGVLAGSLLALAVFGSYYGLDKNGSVFARTLFFTTTSLSVFCFLPALDAWRTAAGPLATAVRNVSLWSYSLYLCHLPVRSVLNAAFGDPELVGAPMGAATMLLLTAAFVVLSLAVAGLNYRFFERPAMDLRERFGAR